MAETLPNDLSGHFILCGFGHVGHRIAELLYELGEPYVVVTRDIRPEWRETTVARAARFIEGDARVEANLRAAGIATARALFIVTDNDLVNTEIALDAQKLNANLPAIVRIFDLYLAERVTLFVNVRCVLSPAMLTAPVFVAAALGEERLRVFDIGNCPLHVVRLPLHRQLLLPDDTLEQFCQRHNLIPLALHRQSEPQAESGVSGVGCRVSEEPINDEGKREKGKVEPTPEYLNTEFPTPDTRHPTPLSEGDELIVVGSGADAESLLARAEETSSRLRFVPQLPKSLQPKERIRAVLAFLRTLDDVWRHAPPVLQHAFMGLVVFVMLSTIVIRYALPGEPSWIASLYFVITTMTTVGFGDYNFKDAPWWLQLYGCGMLLSGALLVAILFGIVTDYIVTLRVEQTLGRLPTRLNNHVVVVGLGDVGSRVAEMLNRLGIPVVAIERTPEHEAVPTLQDKIHVIIADANREGTMRQANIPHARALVVTATSDLDSLRIAHLAETLNPLIRSVVRIYDSALARKLSGSTGLETMVNAPATAAATFVANALETGVEQGFTLGERLLLLRWFRSEEVEAAGMINKTVRDLRAAGHAILLKTSRTGEQQQTRPVTPNDLINPEDVLLILEEYDPNTRECCSPTLSCQTVENDLEK